MKGKPVNELFAPAPPVGLLKGFAPAAGQVEVDIVVPYSEQAMPGIGEFLFIDLGPQDALVGRVSRFVPAGHLTSLQGDAYLADLAKTEDLPSVTVMRQMLRYTMKMHLLGHLRLVPDGRETVFRFIVGERSFVKLGCRVRYPAEAALAYLCNVGLERDPSAAPLGHLAFGQRVLSNVPVRFSVDRLKGRRSFVFARAGYGKSNLIKYLVSQLYSTPPDVGLLIFDPEGEYALPDAQGRPGLVNVPQIRDRLSLYTNRLVPEQFAAIKKGEAFINFGDYPPQDIVAAFVPPEKQELVFANQLRSLDWDNWRALVDLLARKRYRASDAKIAQATKIRVRQDRDKDGDVVVSAIRNNLIPSITRLHRNETALSRNLVGELRAGRVVIVDTSLTGAEDALAISGLVLHRIFSHNRRHFTEPGGSVVRCLAVIEEAQTVLGDRWMNDRNIFVRWVKEGRKYGLGCILVTQQPGAISDQIISQGDNFFVLHLLNETDLRTLARHNGYYSDDLLGFIRNEPIPGNCYFWCAPDQPFVLPARVADFASVARKAPSRPARPPAARRLDAGGIRTWVRTATAQAINAELSVWVYPVDGAADGGPFVVFSRDYLLAAVKARILSGGAFRPAGDMHAWCESELHNLVEKAVTGLGGRTGFAVLAGGKRAVWVLPESVVRLSGGKTLRSEKVEVSASL